MPFFGSVGGNFEAKGIGGYHAGVPPLEKALVTTSISSPLVTPANNVAIYIPTSYGSGLVVPSTTTIWGYWQNLPAYLSGNGKLCTVGINEVDAGTFTTTRPCRAYMLRNPGWNAVDTTGWTSYETAKNYLSPDTNTTVYYKDIAAGTYTFDNNSAMYVWDFTLNSGGYTSSDVLSSSTGTYGYHVTTATSATGASLGTSAYDPFQMGNITYSLSSGALPTGFSLNTSTGLITGTYTPAGINTDGTTYTFTIRATDNNAAAQYVERTFTLKQNVPFLYKQIITRNYMVGGYQNSSLWSNANRVLHSNDTSTNLGDGCIDNYHYKSGGVGDTKGYIFNGSSTTAFNMRTEVKSNSGASPPAAWANTGSAQDSNRLKIYTAGEAVGSMYRFTISTETFANLGGAAWNDHGACVSGEFIGIWWTNTSSSTAKVNWANETVSSASFTAGTHGQQKGLSAKTGYGYAGNTAAATYLGGYTFNKVNLTTSTEASGSSVSKPCGNSGEENYGMGQTAGYVIALYDGAQNNRSGKLVYSSDTATEINGSLSPGGHSGASSGHCFHRD